MKNILNEINQDNQIQVWFDLDGVLADMEKGIENNEQIQDKKKALDDIINNNKEFDSFRGLNNDLLKLKIKSELEKNPENIELKKLKKAYKEYNSSIFRVAGKPGFYINLELMDKAKEMLVKAKELTGVKPNILTAPAGNENDPKNPSVLEKTQWVENNFGGLINKLEITIDKGRVVTSKNDILIDDRQKYVDKFLNAGGTGILFKNPEQAMNELEKKCNENK